MKSEKVCITAALPYANGPIHLGHLVEYIQADIATRYHRLQGKDTVYICGSDAHGTAIMLAASKQGITPEELCEQVHKEHAADLAAFAVDFDNFHTTHSNENQEIVNSIYKKLQDAGDISTRTIEQAYDAEQQMFLPDRYVKGSCPRCKEPDQYGDNCEACGASYTPAELINPCSTISGKPPQLKATQHLFFELENHHEFLEQWLDSGSIPDASVNKLKEWFGEKLRAWDISRDAPYFGFKIPDTTDKYFYVWLDAPIGYMASYKNLANRDSSLDFTATWEKNSNTKLYHFIGKDILYFHALFWPAMLHSAGYRLPNKLFVHGYLTINGEKMSKSRGTFITAKQYLELLEPEYLRYYYAAKLSHSTDDIDLNLEDFRTRINSDLVGKFVNIASRCAGFIHKHFSGQLAESLPEPEMYAEFVKTGDEIAELYEQMELSKAVRLIMELADHANQYIDQQKPWTLAKTKPVAQEVQAITTQGLNLFKLLATYLKPILPKTAQRVELFLNCEPLSWENRQTPLLNQQINPFKPLITRIAPEQTDALAATAST